MSGQRNKGARGTVSRSGTDSLTALGQYLAEIKAQAPLSAEEERCLAARAATGDRDALDSLVQHHLPLVVGIARRYAGDQVALEDLIQEGNLGLLHAAKKFDPVRGVRFATYASWWVRQRISRAVYGLAHVFLVPRTVRKDVQRLAAATAALRQRCGVRPADAQLASAIGRSPARVRFLRSVPEEPVSLDHELNGGGRVEPAVFSDAGAAGESDVDLMARGLPPRLWQVVRLRFGLDGGPQRTLREVGTVLHISRERVRQLERRAFKRMREHPVA